VGADSGGENKCRIIIMLNIENAIALDFKIGTPANCSDTQGGAAAPQGAPQSHAPPPNAYGKARAPAHRRRRRRRRRKSAPLRAAPRRRTLPRGVWEAEPVKRS